MINIDEVVMRELILHRVCPEGQTSTLNATTSEVTDDDEVGVFKRIFLKPFTNHSSTFEFAHQVDINYNVLFKLATEIYENEDDFVEVSKKIANHLMSVSKHPNIKEGDLFIAKFDDIGFGGMHHRALGIYKFEDKDSYIETVVGSKEVKFNFKKGIGGRKPDKACLVLYTDEPYTLLVIDNSNTESDFWQNEFIKHKPKNDFVNNTNDFLGLTKHFITEDIPSNYEVTKADQIDLLNRSVEYFKTHETFDKQEFEQEVFQHEHMIDSFRKFDQSYRAENQVDISDTFEISAQSVKKQARVFKSVLKLDKNFHIYIHGDRQMIENGTDEDGRKYYKIYYEQES